MKQFLKTKGFLYALALVGFLAVASSAHAILVSPNPLGALGTGCSIAVSGGPTLSGTVQWDGTNQKNYCSTGMAKLSTGTMTSSAASVTTTDSRGTIVVAVSHFFAIHFSDFHEAL